MTDTPDTRLVSECQLEIERAWNQARDDAPVHRLAAAHPQLAETLYEFFASMIEADDYLDRPAPEFAGLDRKVRDRVALELERASEPARPKSFLALLREATGETVDAIAASMNVTPDFLVDASEHGSVLPIKAREELVRRARRGRSPIDERDALMSFDAPPSLRRAASRDAAYKSPAVTFQDVVNRASLNDREKQFWLGLSKLQF